MKRSEFIATMMGLAICGLPGGAYAARETLYNRLGGETAVHLVVDGVYNRLLTDPLTAPSFTGVDLPHLKNQILAFLGQAFGGPEKYDGPDMKTVHQNMKITEAQWNVTAKAVMDSLDNCMVPKKEYNEVMKIVASLKGDIVTAP